MFTAFDGSRCLSSGGVSIPSHLGSLQCMLLHVHVHVHVGVLCCFALFVCLTLLASFFLPSHLSFKNMYMHPNIPTTYLLCIHVSAQSNTEWLGPNLTSHSIYMYIYIHICIYTYMYIKEMLYTCTCSQNV